ncbi:hypothetical protein [Leptospira haakeii]|uniref:Ankyrin repeat domain-containing protein n=1 Tax=Leptospira haakeii TaxID=2023198 RepID=A0ABX4PEY8_9LEPT|nr:hypothetical protein [Leptospira haakeii]PKA14334.1 hypothetical protein CH363_19240 [Leptospira haakeii]PKA18192.1 hypothetical protein CH377_18995 [Leptospira haakeii]
MKNNLTIFIAILVVGCSSSTDKIVKKYKQSITLSDQERSDWFPDADSSNKSAKGYKSPLYYSASYGDFDTFNYLVNIGANYQIKDLSGNNLLSVAAGLMRFDDNCRNQCLENRIKGKLKIINILKNKDLSPLNLEGENEAVISSISSAFFEPIPLLFSESDLKNKSTRLGNEIVECYNPDEDLYYSGFQDQAEIRYRDKIKILNFFQNKGVKFDKDRICKLQGFEKGNLLKIKLEFIERAKKF